jgi:hypothetical protein
MSRATIEWIWPHHFRAFGAYDEPILLPGQLSIIYGGNGTGKSSLAEAIEWLLFGYTTRRRKGESFSKDEYRGSYARNQESYTDIPYVEAQVKLQDGTTHVLRRTILVPTSGKFDDTESVLSIDGHHAAYADIGLGVLPVYNPVITQHGIQDFIHTRPIDRYRAISDALGLTDLVLLKDALDSARTAFKNNPPEVVVAASLVSRGLQPHLRVLGLEKVAKRWSKQDYQLAADYEEIAAVASGSFGLSFSIIGRTR